MRCMRTLWSGPSVLAVAIAVAAFSAPAHANPFPFEGISNNDAGDTAILESQMFVTVSDGDPGEVVFTLDNIGPEQSTITAVYFDDSTSLLTGINDLTGSPGVNFSVGGAPPVLPAGNEVDFDEDYFATADNPGPQNGVNIDEFLDVVMGLSGGVTTDDVVDAVDAGDLRVGIHVTNYESGGSESGVSIPEPSSLAALGLGAFALGMRRRRRR